MIQEEMIEKEVIEEEMIKIDDRGRVDRER